MGRYEESVIDLTKALEIESENAIALFIRESSFDAMHRNEDAIVDFTRSLEIDQTNPSVQICRGIAYIDMNDMKKQL